MTSSRRSALAARLARTVAAALETGVASEIDALVRRLESSRRRRRTGRARPAPVSDEAPPSLEGVSEVTEPPGDAPPP